MSQPLSNNTQRPLEIATNTENFPDRPTSLAADIEKHLRQYFKVLGDNHLHEPSGLYELMLNQFEKPLLTVVLEHTSGNQSRMAEILGINRGTLRKKLKQHGLNS